MLKYFITFSLFVISPIFCASTPNPITADLPPPIVEPAELVTNELTKLDQLISVTELNLEKQKILKNKILEYQKIQASYLKNPEDKELSFKMIKAAHRILENIKDNHLTETFNPDFLSELTLLSQIANKPGIPKP